ncbi:MAG: alpha-amylase family glycosyl hydrolase, partial [Myxococcota bacterium]
MVVSGSPFVRRWSSALILASLLACATTRSTLSGSSTPSGSPSSSGSSSPSAAASTPSARAENTRPAPASLSAEAFRALPYEKRWYSNAVMYEVMVRSFSDSNGDGIGDLRGLTTKLDYLNTGDPSSTSDLKVDALWLMPLFKAPSYHGYDTTDYYTIDPVYGTLEDFKTLVAEAHKRGIRILLDLVLNHTSNQHPWFQQAARSTDPQQQAWYVWGTEKLDWERPWGGGPVWHARGPQYYYGLFWEGMPDLNFKHPPVQEELIKIARYWLEQGADGYRLDAIRYLVENGKGQQAEQPETHAYLKRMASSLRTLKPEVALIGEVWTDTQLVAQYYGAGDELDLCFGFEEAGGIISSVASHQPQELIEALRNVEKHFPERRFSAPFLTNHDMPRLASMLKEDVAKQKLAAALLLSLPGTPFLYQGEEIGLTNGPRAGDEGKRTPMQWDNSSNAGFSSSQSLWNPLSGKQEQHSVAVQSPQPDSLLSWYRQLIRFRKSSTAMLTGQLLAPTRGEGEHARVLTFYRVSKGEVMLGVFNLGVTATPARSLTISAEALEKAGLKEAGLKEAGLKEAGLKEAGLKEAGLKEAGLKGAGLKEAGVKGLQNA